MTALATMVRGARNTFRSGTNITETNIRRSLQFSQGGSIALIGGESVTYEALYRTQPWVRAAIDRTANMIARLPIKVYSNPDEPDARERVREGPLAELIKRPWLPDGTTTDFLQAIVKNLCWHGNMVFVKGDGELIPSNAGYWSIKEHKGLPFYYFRPGGGQEPKLFFPDDVVHFKFWGTGKGFWAPSPMESIRSTLMLEDAAQRAMISSFENGMRQSGFFTAPKEMPEAQFQRLRAQMAEQGTGPDNAFRRLLFDNGITWQSMSNNAEESQLVELRKMNREEVSAAFGKSPPMIGILDRSTFNNIEELHGMEHDDADVWATMIEQTIEAQVIEPDKSMTGQYAELDLNKILRGDPVKRFDSYAKAVGGPWLTANEARAKENLPPVDGGDVLLSPLNSAPADERPA